MAENSASLSPVPRTRGPVPVEQPTAEAVDLVVDGAGRLAEILNRTSMRRISVSMEGVQWDIEAPEPVAVQVVPAAATPPATVQPAPQPAAAQSAGQPLTSPLVGVFYRSKNPGSAPFVAVGDRVEAGQQVAIVEAMKMMNEVTATRAGVVSAIHVEDGEVVEYGQTLFTIDDQA